MGVLVLANHKLSNSTTLASLSKTFTEKLHKYALNAAATEMGQKHELTKILSKFSAQQIRCLLIKGTPLAYSHYPEPYLRSRCDTDILFATKEDAEKAWLILKELGYTDPTQSVGNTSAMSSVATEKRKSAYRMQWTCTGKSATAKCMHVPLHLKNSIHNPEQSMNWMKMSTRYDTYALLLACLHRIAHKPEGMHNRLIWLYDIHLLATGFTPEQWEELIPWRVKKVFAGYALTG